MINGVHQDVKLPSLWDEVHTVHANLPDSQGNLSKTMMSCHLIHMETGMSLYSWMKIFQWTLTSTYKSLERRYLHRRWWSSWLTRCHTRNVFLEKSDMISTSPYYCNPPSSSTEHKILGSSLLHRLWPSEVRSQALVCPPHYNFPSQLSSLPIIIFYQLGILFHT